MHNILAPILLGLAAFSRAACVHKKLVFTWENVSPDGLIREGIVTNGQFPSPTLEFDEGDDVEVVVHNKLPFNITVHWHGLLQQGSPWSDGVPGLSQTPIEPNSSFIYRFQAEPAGTYWYHSHTRMTMIDGLYGAVMIKPKKEAPRPWHLISNHTADIKAMERAAKHSKAMVVSDWMKFTATEFWDAQLNTGLDLFCVDSILINGKGSINCPGRDYLISQTNPHLQSTFGNDTVSDKGCFPFNFATEDVYLNASKPALLPAGLWSGCTPTVGTSEIVEVDAAQRWISLSWIGAATFVIPEVSLDGHTLWVYEVDGQYIQPHYAKAVSMYIGERYSVMIKLDQKPGNYTLRISDTGASQVISTNITFMYKGGQELTETPESYIDYGGNVLGETLEGYFSPNSTLVDSLYYPTLPPFPAIAPAAVADAEFTMWPDRLGHAWAYSMSGNISYQQDRDSYTPLLYHPETPDAYTPGLVIRTINGSWVDLVIQVSDPAKGQEASEFPHYMHKHSSKVWLIGHGNGVFNWSSVADAMKESPSSFNLVNPNYRDTFLTSFFGTSWIVLRYQVTNPGAWLFHCHIETHLAGGMGMVIMDGVDVWPEIPPEYAVDQHGYYLTQHHTAACKPPSGNYSLYGNY